MEQGNLPPRPPLEDEPGLIETPSETTRHSILNRAVAVAALGTAIAAFAVVGIKGAKDLNSDPNKIPGETTISKANYAPAGEFDDSHPTAKATAKGMVSEYLSEGHDTGLLAPDPDTRQFYRGVFSNSEVGISKHIPHLEEVAYIQDQDMFRPEYENHLYVYPFTILNNTEHPVDLMYMNYSVRAIKSWLNEKSNQSEGFKIGEDTRTLVQSRAVPHRIVMTNKLPSEMRSALPKSDGVTKWYVDSTASFIKDSGPDSNPFVPWIVGTEVCQALVDVYGEEVVPGYEEQQRDAQNYVAEFNADAAQNIDLATQERLCNALGRQVAAAYFGGRDAIDRLPAESSVAGDTKTPWLSYAPLKSQVPTFIRIAKGVRSGHIDSTIITTSGNNSPTARFYRLIQVEQD